ncbi:MAG TPA: hypothetical protein VL087_05805 [Nitrospirota bacterium]|nr:hypothetical protein [Nitrospirota bacterium]
MSDQVEGATVHTMSVFEPAVVEQGTLLRFVINPVSLEGKANDVRDARIAMQFDADAETPGEFFDG